MIWWTEKDMIYLPPMIKLEYLKKIRVRWIILATHFHSGIDIRTGGVEGLPVVCVKDGKVVRVSVSAGMVLII